MVESAPAPCSDRLWDDCVCVVYEVCTQLEQEGVRAGGGGHGARGFDGDAMLFG